MNAVLQSLSKLVRWRHSAHHRRWGPSSPLYRLRTLPEPDDRFRGVAVNQLLSTLSVRAVSRNWMQWKTGMSTAELDSFLAWLAAQQVLEPVKIRAVETAHCDVTPMATLAVV
jgi:hypothetical protein